MSKTLTHDRERLLSRKREVYAALRTLEQDSSEGTIDAAAYRQTRYRYELEAAEILAQLDTLPEEGAEQDEQPAAPRGVSRPGSVQMLLAGGAVAAALIIFLLGALHPRGVNQSLTGDQVQATPVPTVRSSPQLRAAARAVLAHPRSVAALIALGNADLQVGDAAAADRSYQRAVSLAPRRPEARTLHAMMLGSAARYTAALTLLGAVERDTPTYTRAWLIDGLLSSHIRADYPRAIGAWQRFLTLDPHNTLAPQVRQWIAATRKAERAGR